MTSVENPTGSSEELCLSRSSVLSEVFVGDDGQGDEDIDGGGGNALTDGVGVNDGSDVEIPFEVRGAGMWSLPYEYCAVYVLSPRRIGCESCMPNEIAKC